MARTFKTRPLYITDDADFEHHGAAILLLVRDQIARDWATLERAFRFDEDGRAFHSGHLALKKTIHGLISAGLLESEEKYLGPYRVTETALAFVDALGISLTQAANMTYFGGLGVRPTFGKPSRLDKAAHVFVVMPFEAQLRRVYDGPIKKACRSLRLSVERADDIFSAAELMENIWIAIANSGALIADCTGRNANVFYEIGIAHTLGKPVILIAQRDEDVPADVRPYRFIRYSPSPSGLQRLRGSLRRTLTEVGEGVWAV